MVKSVILAICFIAVMFLLGSALVGYEIVPAIVGAAIWIIGPVGAIAILARAMAKKK